MALLGVILICFFEYRKSVNPSRSLQKNRAALETFFEHRTTLGLCFVYSGSTPLESGLSHSNVIYRRQKPNFLAQTKTACFTRSKHTIIFRVTKIDAKFGYKMQLSTKILSSQACVTSVTIS